MRVNKEMNLKGNKYTFSDIKYVNTGFIDSGRNKGEFIYNIEFENGKKLRLAYPSMTQVSENFDDDLTDYSSQYIDGMLEAANSIN